MFAIKPMVEGFMYGELASRVAKLEAKVSRLEIENEGLKRAQELEAMARKQAETYKKRFVPASEIRVGAKNVYVVCATDHELHRCEVVVANSISDAMEKAGFELDYIYSVFKSTGG